MFTPNPVFNTVKISSCNNRKKCLPNILHPLFKSLGLALDARDKNTYYHSIEVADISSIIASEMGLSKERIELIHIAGHLHDIGKIGIPDNILQKSEPLNRHEWKVIKSHPVIGANIILPLKKCFSSELIDIVLYHHERFDGQGYPLGLRGKNIPLGARIVAVADAISAMLQARPYRPAMPFEIVVQEILSNSGTQFCPVVVNAFKECIIKIEGYFKKN
ncbi:hypothetical protein JCM12298_05600 [Desulfothermus naphthae]